MTLYASIRPSPALSDLPATLDLSTPNLQTLQAWLAPRLQGMGSTLNLQRLQGGQSNPSWVMRSDGQAWVLRAKPGLTAGLLPSAHAIEREFEVMRALQSTGVPVPRVQVLCEDESVIGAAFYVMDYVDGRIFREADLPDQTPAQRAAIHDEANRVIAALHGVDWAAAGLSDFGRHQGYFDRLIARWTRQYRATASSPVSAMEKLMAWLPDHIPPGAQDPQHTKLTHGDFRLENLMFHPTEPRVLAVLDWELSTLGHPLSDLAYHCMAWHLPPGVLRGLAGQDLVGLGIPSEQVYITRYCLRTGREVDAVMADWPFYLACNFFRLAAILQGIAQRVADGTASNASASEISAMSGPVAELGWAIAQRTYIRAAGATQA